MILLLVECLPEGERASVEDQVEAGLANHPAEGSEPVPHALLLRHRESRILLLFVDFGEQVFVLLHVNCQLVLGLFYIVESLQNEVLVRT